MQIGPLNSLEGELRFDHGKHRRVDIDVQCAVEIVVQVEPARLEERTLPVQRAVGIILRRPRGDPVAAGKQTGEQVPVRGHEVIVSGADGFAFEQHFEGVVHAVSWDYG